VAAERIHRQTERTPEERARLQALREQFQKEKPALEDLVASGEYDGPVPQGAYLELRRVLHALRSERQRQGLSLADVAARSGIDKAALSRLETGKQINPTIDTLWRYAQALGKRLAWGVLDEETAARDTGDALARVESALVSATDQLREVIRQGRAGSPPPVERAPPAPRPSVGSTGGAHGTPGTTGRGGKRRAAPEQKQAKE
jgi:transcriptional regulator with XRE-family HTH domain